MKYTGYRAIKAGLLGETYIEAMHIDKMKVGYEHVAEDADASSQVSLSWNGLQYD